MSAFEEDISGSVRQKLGLIQIATMMWRLLRAKDKRRIAVLFALMVVAAAYEMVALAAVQIYMKFLASGATETGVFLDRLIEGAEDRTRLFILSGFLVGVFLTKMALFLGLFKLLAWVVTQQRIELASRLFVAYQQAGYLWHLEHNTADLQRNLQADVQLVTQGVILQMLQLALNVLVSVFVLAFVLMTLPWGLLLSLCAVIGVMVFAAGLAHRVLAQAGQVRRVETREMIFTIQQGFGALTEARLLGRRGWFLKAFRRALSRAAHAQRRVIFVMQSTPIVIETVLMISMMGIIAVVVSTAASLDAALALATVLAAAMFRLRQAMSKIAAASNKISAASPSLRPLVADLDSLEQDVQGSEKPVTAPDQGAFQSLQIENVSFSFRDAARPALQNVDLTLRRGEHLAIVGSTGAGKSTILALLLGLIHPTGGRILVDGWNIAEEAESWQRRLGYVPQSVFMLDDSVAANVAFGVAETARDADAITRALATAQMGDLLASWPQNLETQVGEGGANLSGGQRQRIGLARALYHRPEILILDEATSALDRVTQTSVFQALNDWPDKLTVISVTHKIETLQYSDRVLFLENGEIAGLEHYETLLAQSETFRDLTEQSSPEPEADV